jgi:sugar (pentulose or hexulose) kinase
MRDSYHAQWCQLTERLAELLVAAGCHAEATPLYRQLMLDLYALPSHDRDLVESREAHACALFGCYAAAGDAAGLEQAFEDLRAVLERDDVEGAAATPTRLAVHTLARLEEARQKLRARTVTPSTGRPGDPPAVAGD